MHRIATREQWLAERISLLAKEKALNKARDALAVERRALPWVAVTTSYTFDTPRGPRALGDLFEGRGQLVVYHFMMGPDWKQGCKSCSFWVDTFARIGPHLAARNVTMCAVSRAPLETITAFKSRMGWTFPWVSSLGSEFNSDFGVTFTSEQTRAGAAHYNFGSRQGKGEEPGLSVFARDDAGAVFHTYSAYGRGLDPLNNAYQILDLVPEGRNESGLEWPMQWVRLSDEYPRRKE